MYTYFGYAVFSRSIIRTQNKILTWDELLSDETLQVTPPSLKIKLAHKRGKPFVSMYKTHPLFSVNSGDKQCVLYMGSYNHFSHPKKHLQQESSDLYLPI